jgi:hypothetical protein
LFIRPILGKLRSFPTYSVYTKRGFSCKLGEKKFSKKTQICPLNCVKIVFRNFVLLNTPELVFCSHFHKKKSNSVKLILSILSSASTVNKLNIVLHTISISLNFKFLTFPHRLYGSFHPKSLAFTEYKLRTVLRILSISLSWFRTY